VYEISHARNQEAIGN